MSSGWHKDSWRHSLAAKGVKTKPRYFAIKDSIFIDPAMAVSEEATSAKVDRISDALSERLRPRTVTQRLKEEEELRKELKKITIADRGDQRVLKDIESNRFSSARAAISDPSLLNIADIVERKRAVEAIQSALNAKATSLAASGLSIPKGLEDTLDPDFIAGIRNIQESRRKVDARSERGPIAGLANELIPKAIGSLAEAPGMGIRMGAEEWSKLPTDTIDQSLLSNIDNGLNRRAGTEDFDLKDNPFVTDNVFIGNEEDGQLKVLQEEVPRLSDNFNFAGQGTGNPALAPRGGKQETTTDRLTKQVDSLHGARDKLADVDLSVFDKGTDAFVKGDREGLISSIIDLQKQEQTLKDRFSLVNTVGRNVLSQDNLGGSFSGSSDNFITNLMGSGADILTDQTNKINEVKKEIIDSNNKVFARRRQLEYRLKRLDSVVPPETDVPSEVTRFKKDKGFNLGDSNILFGDS